MPVDGKTMTRIRSYLLRSHEIAGTLRYDKTRGHLGIHGKIVKGHADSVTIPHGLVEMHTHPNSCRNIDKDCGIDVPSPEDIAILLDGRDHGNVAHIVFALTATYVLTALPRAYARNELVVKALDRLYETLPDKLEGMSNSAFLDEFRRRWVVVANRVGIRVRIYKPHETPHVPLPSKELL